MDNRNREARITTMEADAATAGMNQEQRREWLLQEVELRRTESENALASEYESDHDQEDQYEYYEDEATSRIENTIDWLKQYGMFLSLLGLPLVVHYRLEIEQALVDNAINLSLLALTYAANKKYPGLLRDIVTSPFRLMGRTVGGALGGITGGVSERLKHRSLRHEARPGVEMLRAISRPSPELWATSTTPGELTLADVAVRWSADNAAERIETLAEFVEVLNKAKGKFNPGSDDSLQVEDFVRSVLGLDAEVDEDEDEQNAEFDAILLEELHKAGWLVSKEGRLPKAAEITFMAEQLHEMLIQLEQVKTSVLAARKLLHILASARSHQIQTILESTTLLKHGLVESFTNAVADLMNWKKKLRSMAKRAEGTGVKYDLNKKINEWRTILRAPQVYADRAGAFLAFSRKVDTVRDFTEMNFRELIDLCEGLPEEQIRQLVDAYSGYKRLSQGKEIESFTNDQWIKFDEYLDRLAKVLQARAAVLARDPAAVNDVEAMREDIEAIKRFRQEFNRAGARVQQPEPFKQPEGDDGYKRLMQLTRLCQETPLLRAYISNGAKMNDQAFALLLLDRLFPPEKKAAVSAPAIRSTPAPTPSTKSRPEPALSQPIAPEPTLTIDPVESIQISVNEVPLEGVVFVPDEQVIPEPEAAVDTPAVEYPTQAAPAKAPTTSPVTPKPQEQPVVTQKELVKPPKKGEQRSDAQADLPKVKIEKGEKGYSCPHCGKSGFKGVQNVNDHIRGAHGLPKNDPPLALAYEESP